MRILRHHGGEGPDHHGHGRREGEDYLAAVAEYRATFPSKADVERETPDPAVRALLGHLARSGCETCFDRFDAQKPQCAFGIAGTCCRNCNMGPCRITEKAPRGVCGADADLIVARNLLRWVAAGTAAHAARGRESILALAAAARGEAPFAVEGIEKLRASAAALKIPVEGRGDPEIALDLAKALLEDLSRTEPGAHRLIEAFATGERRATWKALGILPTSAYHEVFESLHRTTTGTDSDWRNVMKQTLRCGLAFAWTSVLGSAIAQDVLFGLPRRSRVRCNVGALDPTAVSIAVHGHSPVLVSEIVRVARLPETIEEAKAAGASGIGLYGICCSGLSAMYRYGGVVPLSNAIGAELVLGTGALDLWVADVQDVFPAIMEVAACFKTVVVTTNDGARLPGAEHYGFDRDLSNLAAAESIARTIVRRAIRAHGERRDVPVFIPPNEVEAEVGFSVEGIKDTFGGLGPLRDALREGRVKGIVNLVGCNNPRILYEKAILELAESLIASDILVLTNGCASFPLLKMGLCSPSALAKAGSGLRSILEPYSLPPVWHMGECLDNARASGLFRALADLAGLPVGDMPFAFSSPEWSNEKGVGAALGFRLLGLDSYHCVFPPVLGSRAVRDYLFRETKDSIGGVMVVDPDHLALARKIAEDLGAKRKKAGFTA